MNINFEIPNQLVEKVVRGIMDNFPEASCTLRCVEWNYDDMKFTFVDDEEDKTYTIEKDKLMAIFPALFSNKWPKGLTKPPLSAEWDDWNNWLCQSDVFDFDAFVQLACLGEVIYG